MMEREAMELEVCCRMVGIIAMRLGVARIVDSDVSSVFVGLFFGDW